MSARSAVIDLFSRSSQDMLKPAVPTPKREIFTYRVVCKTGFIVEGYRRDFLVAIQAAIQEKAEVSLYMPNIALGIVVLYPNGQPVANADMEAALRALADKDVHAVVMNRMVVAAGAPPAAQARTERTAGAAFCQAGVVAPPDSLTGETSTVSNSVEQAS
jgi:hypothetical protein